MAALSGWCFSIEKDGRLRLLMVATPHQPAALRMALNTTEGGVVRTRLELEEGDLQAMGFEDGEVREWPDVRLKPHGLIVKDFIY